VSRTNGGFAGAWSTVADVQGWMTEEQGRALFDAARRCPADGRIVEIGSFQGRSTIVLAMAADPSVEVVAIDPHAGNDRGPQEIAGFTEEAEGDHARFAANLAAAGVRDRVTHLRKLSDDAVADVEGPIDVLYIDGAHRYAPARADIRQWGAKVTDGGTLLVHDSFSSIGVTLAILRELVPSHRFRYVGRSRSLAIYRVDASRSRWGSVARQLAQLPWFAVNVAKKILITARVLRHTEWPY
jgi:predicted O-methyltransferase YrrM